MFKEFIGSLIKNNIGSLIKSIIEVFKFFIDYFRRNKIIKYIINNKDSQCLHFDDIVQKTKLTPKIIYYQLKKLEENGAILDLSSDLDGCREFELIRILNIDII
ncbi:ArsR family transcriptional regulator [Clostridium thermobutyricum]|uniref:Uncharacterized protein n=1 Tax=Clostridium thermobutyricum TaxID=29372 RepID=N9XT60_9CLOT|nr:ArsR family transcriptional regulator [Clostridium thermobutyricum]ENY98771.1 hypothetical protein HMPREF1092_03329 [Clostridium thermobutyricum]